VRNRLAAAWAWLYRSPDRAAIAIRTAIQTLSGGLVAWWVADGDGRITTIPDVVAQHIDIAGGSALLAGLAALGWHARRPPTGG
jgi:hypothetical protein